MLQEKDVVVWCQYFYTLYTIPFVFFRAFEHHLFQRIWLRFDNVIVYSYILYNTILVDNLMRMFPLIIYHWIRIYSSFLAFPIPRKSDIFSNIYNLFLHCVYYSISYWYKVNNPKYYIPFNSPLFQHSGAISFETIECILKKILSILISCLL